MSKFDVELKPFLRHGLSEPEFYDDVVYKFKKIVGRTDFSDQFRKIIIRIGYNLNMMRQSACLVFTQSRLVTMLHSLIARHRVGCLTL